MLLDLGFHLRFIRGVVKLTRTEYSCGRMVFFMFIDVGNLVMIFIRCRLVRFTTDETGSVTDFIRFDSAAEVKFEATGLFGLRLRCFLRQVVIDCLPGVSISSSGGKLVS